MKNKNIYDHKLLNNRIYLYMTEFFAGMAVMAVELGASRLLAPYFSSSQIVWTIIIGTIMIAMALGNLFGGKNADKNPNPDKLYRRILISAVWIAAIPVLGKYIIVIVAGLLVLTVDTGFLIIAAFICCMVIFVFPLFLLGTVTPSLVKYTTNDLDKNASIVGMLGASNTIGSIIGTFLPTFVTIPAVGTSITFLIFSGILLVIAIAYFITVKRKIILIIVCTVLYLICIMLGNRDSFAFWETGLTYEGESMYNYLQVKDTGDRTTLSTNVLFGVQSVTVKDESLTGMYYDYALAAPLMSGYYDSNIYYTSDSLSSKDKFKILILGMGTGTYSRQCKTYLDTLDTHPASGRYTPLPLDITGVEIDEKITDLSHKYFDASADIDVSTYDGRAYLHAISDKYDVIMVDAYQDITIPFQMSSVEFFTEVYDHLYDSGVMVVNMNMHSDKDENINTYLSDTISEVFPDVSTVDVAHTTNRELFASKGKSGTALSILNNTLAGENVRITPDTDKKSRDFISLMNTVSDNLHIYQPKGHILTDDKAPVELLGMAEIDDLISKELAYYKKIYKEKGLSGLLR